VVDNYLNKAVDKQLESLSLNAMKMKQLPNISIYIPQLQCLTNLNLAKNSLFNGDELFQVKVLFVMLPILFVFLSSSSFFTFFNFSLLGTQRTRAINTTKSIGKLFKWFLVGACRQTDKARGVELGY
jgi:hypothetical protein